MRFLQLNHGIWTWAYESLTPLDLSFEANMKALLSSMSKWRGLLLKLLENESFHNSTVVATDI